MNAAMYAPIFRNLPGNPDWQGSFYEELTEHGIWCVDEFWKLHMALVQAAEFEFQPTAINRELALAVATLYSKITNLILAHYNVNDVFQIENLTHDELIAFAERFEHAVLSVFSGDMIPESSYELTNPLITER